MKQFSKKAKLCAAVGAAATSLVAAQSALAILTWDTVSGDGTAITAGSGTWDLNTTANWNDGLGGANVVWPVPGDAAVFEDPSASATSNITVFNGVGGTDVIQANSLTFNAAGFSLTGGSLTLNYATDTANLIAASGVTATVGSAINGSILWKTGTGTVQVNDASTLTGGAVGGGLGSNVSTVLHEGTLRLGASNALPTGSSIGLYGGNLDLNNFNQTVTGVTFRSDSGQPIRGGSISTGTGTLTLTDGSITTNFAPHNASLVDVTFSGNINIGGISGGSWSINSSAPASNPMVISANILGTASESLNLNTANTGVIVLGGNNTFGGGINLQRGTLRATHPDALGTGQLTTASGTTARLEGGGTFANAMLINTNTSETAGLAFGSGTYTLTGAMTTGGGVASLVPDDNTTVTINGNMTPPAGTFGFGFGSFAALPQDGGGVPIPTNITFVVNGTYNGNLRDGTGSGTTVYLNGSNNITNGFSIGWGDSGWARMVIGADGALGQNVGTAQMRGITGAGVPGNLSIGNTFEFRTDYTAARVVVFNNAGINAVGSVYSAGGNHTFGTALTLRPTGGFSGLGVEAGTTLTVNSAWNQGGTNRNLVKVLPGTLIIDPTAAGNLNGIQGRIIVNEGLLSLPRSWAMTTATTAAPFVLPQGLGLNVGMLTGGNSKAVLGTNFLSRGMRIGTVLPDAPVNHTNSTANNTLPAGADLAGLQGLDLNNFKATVYNAQFNAALNGGSGGFDSSPTLYTELGAAILRAESTAGDGIFDSNMPADPRLRIVMLRQQDDAANVDPSTLAPLLSDGIVAEYFEIGGTTGQAGNRGWALKGDANRDGAVDVSDLGILGLNWASTTNLDYSKADFDYSGAVDVSDLGILGLNWAQTAAGFSGPVSNMSFAEALKAVGLDGVAIPEPSSLSLLALGGLGLMRRRRRS